MPRMDLFAGELDVAGALRSARADVSEAHPLDGLRLAVEIKPINLAVGRAIWNRFGDVQVFAVNIHLKFPFAVVGGVLALPTWEWRRGLRASVRSRSIRHSSWIWASGHMARCRRRRAGPGGHPSAHRAAGAPAAQHPPAGDRSRRPAPAGGCSRSGLRPRHGNCRSRFPPVRVRASLGGVRRDVWRIATTCGSSRSRRQRSLSARSAFAVYVSWQVGTFRPHGPACRTATVDTSPVAVPGGCAGVADPAW